mmetsp:Transcript_7406/g.17854  ORF Transcript_7406/g.17854 Transcript_7406/m.17854 type:complete len:225 (+) Transcript_7406:1918-2592(+)
MCPRTTATSTGPPPRLRRLSLLRICRVCVWRRSGSSIKTRRRGTAGACRSFVRARRARVLAAIGRSFLVRWSPSWFVFARIVGIRLPGPTRRGSIFSAADVRRGCDSRPGQAVALPRCRAVVEAGEILKQARRERRLLRALVGEFVRVQLRAERFQGLLAFREKPANVRAQAIVVAKLRHGHLQDGCQRPRRRRTRESTRDFRQKDSIRRWAHLPLLEDCVQEA